MIWAVEIKPQEIEGRVDDVAKADGVATAVEPATPTAVPRRTQTGTFDPRWPALRVPPPMRPPLFPCATAASGRSRIMPGGPGDGTAGVEADPKVAPDGVEVEFELTWGNRGFGL